VQFAKYHALGNDYLIINPADCADGLSPAEIRMICDRRFGVGSDGILVGPLTSTECDFALRFFNPDGGEFEKSGNGLRIFSRHLWDAGLVSESPFTIKTPGGAVTSQVHPGGRTVTVEMGRMSFDAAKIPVAGPPREVINETLVLNGQEFCFCAATIGNPHCIILCENVSSEQAREWGPILETHPSFPNRTNVQFMKTLSRSRIQIEIWERGVGYTLASGSSSCAAAAVAHRLGLCDEHVAVQMPGGTIEITISEDWSISMTGPVTKVCEGAISAEIFDRST
jgi:diaminopimelate epimerase